MIGEMKINHDALPDWKTNTLFIVWPRGLENRNILEKAYFHLTKIIPEDIELHIIVKSESIIEGISDVIKRKRHGRRVFFHEVPSVMDIWIRDWAPIPVKNEKGEVSLIKACYRPLYITGKDILFAEGDNEAGKGLVNILKCPIDEINLVWDIGNFTHNGNGTAIVTLRLKYDNPWCDEITMRRHFKEKLGVEKLIFMKIEPGDPTLYVDGTVRFLDEKTIAVAKYPEDYIPENKYCDELVETLENDLGEGFTILRIPNGPIEDLVTEGFPSAKGNHLNFLRVGKYLFMPCYGDIEDEQAIEVIANNFPDINVIPVKSGEITKLARRGGVLNCISWGI